MAYLIKAEPQDQSMPGTGTIRVVLVVDDLAEAGEVELERESGPLGKPSSSDYDWAIQGGLPTNVAALAATKVGAYPGIGHSLEVEIEETILDAAQDADWR